MSVEDDIRNQYPALSWLLNDPEVGGLLRQAADPNVGFSPNEFQARLYGTQWFRSRSQRQREWEIIANTDPGEAAAQREKMYLSSKNIFDRLGVNLADGVDRFIAEKALGAGDEPGSAAWNTSLAGFLAQNKDRINMGGEIQGIASQIGASAREDYLIPMTNDTAQGWAIGLALGTADEKGLTVGLQMAAAGTYPHLADRIMNGETMGQIVEPYKQLIADQLGTAPGTINMMDNKWRSMYDFYDPQTQQRRTMTLSEATFFIRNRPEFWQGNQGKALAAEMANRLAGIFGRRV